MKLFSVITHRPVVSAAFFLLLVFGFVAAGRALTNANRHHGPILEQDTRASRPPITDKSMRRNLLLQPEAAKVARRLGNRFSGFTEGASVMSGVLTRGATREPVQITRRQSEAGEAVDLVTPNSSLTWDDTTGFRDIGEKPAPIERDLAEHVICDTVDRFVLDQLRGAAYMVVGRNVREGNTGGAENYEGPLWTVVRVDMPQSARPMSKWRLFYINARTGLIDKVSSEREGRHYEASFSNWSQQNGEWFPLTTTWTSDGEPIMTLSLTSTSVSVQ